MVKNIIIIFAAILAFGCGNSKEKEKPPNELRSEAYNDSKSYIEYHEERVSLLAIAKEIPGETLKSILIDYYMETALLNEIKIKENENIVTNISKKYSVSKVKVASLIYNFEYEMLTRDEIFEIEDGKRAAEEAVDYDPPDQY